MDNKLNNQLNNDSHAKGKEYDVFISYRNTETSIAKVRQIAQAFELKGLKVFVDYREKKKDPFELIKENRCRYYIVVFTYEAKETIEKFDYKTIKAEEKRKTKKRVEPGYNFAKELYLINNCFNEQVFDNKNVFYINVEEYDPNNDKYFSGKGNIVDTLRKRNYKSIGLPIGEKGVQVFDIPTNSEDFESKISSLINEGWITINTDDNNENEPSDRRDEVSVMQGEDGKPIETKKGCNNHKKLIRWLLFLLVALMAAFGVTVHAKNNKISDLENDTILKQKESIIKDQESTIQHYKDLLELYNKECILFAGGGTVRQYLLEQYKINVSDYEQNPGSKYIHIPSTIAWHLLWDDVNEGLPRHYCPIILSTGKIDTIGANIVEFTKTRRIAEYKLDSIPLRVQIYNNDSVTNDSIITLDSLKKILIEARKTNYAKYEIWTTTKESGTYLEYKKLLGADKSFKLDEIVNQQPGGRKDFSLEKFQKNPLKKQIILANEQYFYQKDDIKTDIMTVVSGTTVLTIPLYIYTIATVNNENGNLDILEEAEEFLDSIGCNTDVIKTPNQTKSDKVTVEWPPK